MGCRSIPAVCLMTLCPWWRHHMETFSALLALCAGNSPITGEFRSHKPVTRSFDVYFDLRLNKRLSKQSWEWWFETPSRSLWRHCNERSTMVSELDMKPYLVRQSCVTNDLGSSPQPSGFALGLWWASQVVGDTTMTSILVSIPIIYEMMSSWMFIWHHFIIHRTVVDVTNVKQSNFRVLYTAWYGRRNRYAPPKSINGQKNNTRRRLKGNTHPSS